MDSNDRELYELRYERAAMREALANARRTAMAAGISTIEFANNWCGVNSDTLQRWTTPKIERVKDED